MKVGNLYHSIAILTKLHVTFIKYRAMNCIGELIKSTLDNQTSVYYAELTKELAENARRCVRNLDPSNDLIVLRMGSRKHEILVAPGKLNCNN